MAEVTLADMMQAMEALRQETRAEIAQLKTALAAVQAQLAASGPAKHDPTREATPEVTPEELVILAAAVTAYLGRKVRVRAARLVQGHHETASPWAQHGRVFVQGAAHHLRHGR